MFLVAKCLLLLLSASLAASNCPKQDVHRLGYCIYKMKCYNTIKGAALDQECQGSMNIDVIVDLTLTNVDQNINVDVTDTDFLISITSLTVIGSWPQTNLSFLEYTLKLRNLRLPNLDMKQIDGQPFQYLSRLDTLDLSHNRLCEIDDLFVFADSNRLLKLYLSYNEISDVTGFVFQELVSLIELDLSHNLIVDLKEEPFNNLSSLRILRLNDNNIKYLNGAINKNLLNLKHLFLNDNDIAEVDQATLDKTMYHLETIDLSNNELHYFPKLFVKHWAHFEGHIVCRIIYAGNQLTIIRNATSEEHIMPKIKKGLVDVTTQIDLSNNNISIIEYNAFQYIINLVSLDVSNNNLNTFLVNSEHLANVKFLNISGNFITRLDFQTFSRMNNLQNLDLSNNRFENLPTKSLMYANKLKSLNFTQNDIQEVANFHINFHTEGGILDLSSNDLYTFVLAPGEADGLIELILRSNKINDPSQVKLRYHHALLKLDMSKNLISDLNEKSLQLPITLTNLDLSSNQIETINPSSFYCVQHLHTLRLSHNNLKNINHGVFRGLTSLVNLDLSFNQIASLDSAVLLDLKYLKFLSLRYNHMYSLESKAWLNHKTDLIVYIDGNNLSCDWLSNVLTDYNNGFSKMHPAVINSPMDENTFNGIPCIAGPKNLYRKSKTGDDDEHMIMDERLLLTSQKILEAVREQTSFLRKYIWRSVLNEADKQDGTRANMV
ncbi:PREDICTED: insulin-like growth factor-binding protein complex acid labile subunit [Papilio polytes]|uniref:insulin-like growth factor-binding protein complex acid labile subunit n=1 Tax=Papilio polytes TaxID=76194 RepID=UPI000676863E|nr:PREDICTED: insulin-like growth factor-binding protein complex acid labile subunit [Papilio polytes]